MTGTELTKLLHEAERSPGWLGGKLLRHRSSVLRWMRGEHEVPAECEGRIRELLAPVPR